MCARTPGSGGQKKEKPAPQGRPVLESKTDLGAAQADAEGDQCQQPGQQDQAET